MVIHQITQFSILCWWPLYKNICVLWKLSWKKPRTIKYNGYIFVFKGQKSIHIQSQTDGHFTPKFEQGYYNDIPESAWTNKNALDCMTSLPQLP